MSTKQPQDDKEYQKETTSDSSSPTNIKDGINTASTPQPTTTAPTTAPITAPTTSSTPSDVGSSTPNSSTKSTSPRRLRSGRILPDNSTVSFQNYLDNLYTKVRESGEFSILQCEKLGKGITKSREQRLAQIQKLKEETEKFAQEIKNFRDFPHLTNLESKDSEDITKTPGSVSDSGEGEILLHWISVSLSDSEQEFLLDESEIKPEKFHNMADYVKVAKITSELVPIFSGGQTPNTVVDLQTFLGCCKRVLQCISEQDKPAFLQIYPTRLRGEAYQLIASTQPATFEEAEALLNRTYLPRETYQELVNKLITMRQYPTEALIAFTARIKQSLQLCKEAAETKYGAVAASTVKSQLDDFAKNALKSGVTNPHLCQYLLTIGEDTLENIIQKALDMERLQQTVLNIQPNPLPTIYSPFPITNNPLTTSNNTRYEATPPINKSFNENTGFLFTPPQLNPQAIPFKPTNPQIPITVQHPTNIQAQSQEWSQQQSTQHQKYGSTNSPSINVTCNFCRKRGHTYSECLKRKNTPFCTHCQVYNHDIRDCRRLKFSNEYRQRTPNRNMSPPPKNKPQYHNEIQYRSVPFTREQTPNNNRHANSGSTPNNSNPPRVYNITKKCDFCGRRGHTVNECQQKLRWETKNSGNGKQSGQKSPTRH